MAKISLPLSILLVILTGGPGPDALPHPVQCRSDTSLPPGYTETSEYAIGRVAVGLIFPESDGTFDPSTEDWTEAEKAAAEAELRAALDWWEELEPRADLEFVLSVFPDVPVKYEPIIRDYGDHLKWVNDALWRMGYQDDHGWVHRRAYDAVHDLIDAGEADWGFLVFVVDSSEDRDGRFADHWIAFAYLGGPYLVTTLDGGSSGTENLDSIFAHEIGHIFYALDQYYSARVPCTAQSGVLDIENQNSEYGDCLSDEPSIMRAGTSPYLLGTLDWYARGQVGWRDSDLDGILDPVDEFLNPVYHHYLSDMRYR